MKQNPVAKFFFAKFSSNDFSFSRETLVTALENYSADAVLSGMSRLKSRFGQFKTVYIDLGTNLIEADKPKDEDETEFEGGLSLPNHFPNVVWKHEMRF